jgi:hypothetical protein
VRERAIHRKLRQIEAVPSMETAALLGHLDPEVADDPARDDSLDDPETSDPMRAAE